MQKRLLVCVLSILSVHCGNDPVDPEPMLVSDVSAVAVLPDGLGNFNGGSYNGGSYNGGSYNGGSYNGGSYNGGSYNGGSYNGGSYNGGSYNGGSYNGGPWVAGYALAGFGMTGAVKRLSDDTGTNQGFDGATTYNIYSGLGWTYSGSTGTRNGMGLVAGTVASPYVNAASYTDAQGNLRERLGLHDWINHSDTNGNAGSISAVDPATMQPHYCAGFEQAWDTYNLTLNPGQNYTFQRSSGGGQLVITATGPSGVTGWGRKNAPLTGPGSSPYDVVFTSALRGGRPGLLSTAPGDTVFFIVSNTGTAAVTVSVSVQGTNPACNDSTDVNNRMSALSYLIRCMCPSSVAISFGANDTHRPGENTTMRGALNLGPTWCTGSTAVPEAELQAVSACYMAHLNGKGTHVPISIRGSTGNNTANPSLNPTSGELIMDAMPIGEYFGNIFSAGQGCRGYNALTTGTVPGLNGRRDYECCSGVVDTTSTSPTFNRCLHSTAGMPDGPFYDQHWERTAYGTWWFNSGRYVAQRGLLSQGSLGAAGKANWLVGLGRTCDFDGCGMMVFAGGYEKNSQITSFGLWPIQGSGLDNPNYSSATGDTYYALRFANLGKNLPNVGWSPLITETPALCPNGQYVDTGNGAYCCNGQYCNGLPNYWITGGGKSFRQVGLYIGLITDPLMAQPSGYTPPVPIADFPQGDDLWSFSRMDVGSAPLSSGQNRLCGNDLATGLYNCTNGQRLTGLTGTQTIESVFQYMPKPGSPAQWLPPGMSIDYGEKFTVGIRVSAAVASPFKVQVHQGSTSTDFSWTQKVPSVNTGNAEVYQTVYIYPVYMKAEPVGTGTVPQVRVKISGNSSGAAAPDIDSVQVFAGPPHCIPDANGLCAEAS